MDTARIRDENAKLKTVPKSKKASEHQLSNKLARRLECAFVDYEEPNGLGMLAELLTSAPLQTSGGRKRKSYESLSMWPDNSHIVVFREPLGKYVRYA